MTNTAIDLHTHTRCSDGILSPTELVHEAAKNGLSAMAITDHDTIAGVEEAQLAGEELSIEIIAGLEISAQSDKGVLHMLGYFVDLECEELKSGLQDYVNARNIRNPKIINLLKQLGYHLDMEEIASLSNGEVINRPHIAQAMVNRGYVHSTQEAFDRFLKNDGMAYVPKEIYSVSKAVDLIHRAGGLAVLAHPALLNVGALHRIGDEIRRLHHLSSFDGIEAYHGDCIREHSQYYADIADELGLFITGGSDFHGDSKHQKLGQTRCLDAIPYQFLQDMKQQASIISPM